MKTRIITLESHDDLISVRDRLSWAKTPRILLVWPKGERIVLRSLDLKVLQRHADSLGAQLGLVTRRDAVRREAEALGMPVFESAAAAQKGKWPAHSPRKQRIPRPPRRDLRQLQALVKPAESSWHSRLTVRLAAFSVGVLAVLAVAGLFVPRAAVRLQPEARSQHIVIPIITNASIQSVFVTGSLPSHEETIVVEAGQSTAVKGQIAVPQTRAIGVVRFSNLTPSGTSIPAGTVVSTLTNPPARFATVNDTHLTAGLGQFVETPIEAVEDGASGNVQAGAIQAVEGSLGLVATVTNPEPTQGGSDQNMLGPSQAERSQLHDQLMEALKQNAMNGLRRRLSPGDLLLADTLAVSQTLKEIYNPLPGQPGRSLALTLRVEFRARVVSGQDQLQLAEAVLNAAAPAGFSPVTGSLAYKTIGAPVSDSDGNTRWRMQVDRRLQRQVDVGRAQALVSGRSPEAARAALSQAFPLAAKPQIALTPSWWPWMPLIPFNISVAAQ